MRYAVQNETMPYPAVCDLLNPYPEKGTRTSHTDWMASFEYPLSAMPAENRSNSASRISFFFLPIARRSRSAPPSEYPARFRAIAMTCSW